MDLAPNEAIGWLSLALGSATGALLGLRFHRAEFLGGYNSWPRRLLRLGHISFFGLGLINVLFAVSLARMRLAPHESISASWALLVGNATMPLVCLLAAFRPRCKPLFVIPVATVIYGTLSAAIGLCRMWWSGGPT